MFSVEFYVTLLVATALIIGLIAIPRSSGPVREFLVGSILTPGPPEPEATIEVYCDSGGNVNIIRHGLRDVTMLGAVSAKVVVNGQKITIYERIVPGHGHRNPHIRPDGTEDWSDIAASATFTLDFLARERYYLRYESEKTSTSATLSFHNVPGIHPHPAPLKN